MTSPPPAARPFRFTLTHQILVGLALVCLIGLLAPSAAVSLKPVSQLFLRLIVPSIKPVISLSFILAIAGSLSAFEIPYIMTGGSGESETFVIQTIKLAFQFNKMGLASAAAVVLLAIVLLTTWVQRRLVPDERADLV